MFSTKWLPYPFSDVAIYASYALSLYRNDVGEYDSKYLDGSDSRIVFELVEEDIDGAGSGLCIRLCTAATLRLQQQQLQLQQLQEEKLEGEK